MCNTADNFSQKENQIFIYEKDYSRLKFYSKERENDKLFYYNNDINYLINTFPFYSKEIYCFFKSKNHNTKKHEINIPTKSTLRTIAQFYTNKGKKSFVSLFRLTPYTPVKTSRSLGISSKTLLRNGDIETVSSKPTKTIMQRWIKQGASFYDDNDVFLPQADYLLPVWNKITPKQYPVVYMDSADPISGHFSLHIDLRNGTSPIYCLNTFKATAGTLVFFIKKLSDQGGIRIKRHDYNHNLSSYQISQNFSSYIFPLQDTLSKVEVDIPVGHYLDGHTIIYIMCSNIECLIDNISFVPAAQ